MSRGFVREDDQEEAPFIPPRAPLPEGVPNYVTARGMRLLHEERARLEQERASATGSEDERRRRKAEIDGRLALLQERILTARPVETGTDPPPDVRFGVMVTVAFRSGPQQGVQRSFTIVGVDEASVADHRFAFTAPISRALMNRRVGERVSAVLGAGRQELEVLDIRWPAEEGSP
jgi:transcription elongation factor GreB